MATQKQIAANRANAQKSTGPTSAAGKAASSQNAFRTGLYCEALVARREDLELVRELGREYYAFYNPATPVERDLVDMIIRNVHFIRRVTRAETSLWNYEWDRGDRISNDAEHGAAVKSAGLDFGRVQRRLNQLDRGFHETRERLETLQERRRSVPDRRSAPDAAPDPPPIEGEAIGPEPDFFPAQDADSKPTSSGIGFVPSNSNLAGGAGDSPARTPAPSASASTPPSLMSRFLSLAVLLVALAAAAACGMRPKPAGPSPILVQGAMPSETQVLAERLDRVVQERVGAWLFWRGDVEGYPVIVSKTGKGGANAAAATAIAIERYHPRAILNQGTAGGHQPGLHVFDIVIGKDAVNIGAFKTAARAEGQGSNPLEWTPLDMLATEGSVGQDPRARAIRRFPADLGLLAAARDAVPTYHKGRVVEGTIGSSDVWNSELDRIHALHERFGTAVEEMETAAAAQVAAAYGVPFAGIRVVSNNITNGEPYNGISGEAAQDFIYEVLRRAVRR